MWLAGLCGLRGVVYIHVYILYMYVLCMYIHVCMNVYVHVYIVMSYEVIYI